MSAEEFNEWYKVGQPVMVRDGFGRKHESVTTSKAWDLCGTPVVNCEGFRACELYRIEAM